MIDCPDTADPDEWERLRRSERLIWAWWHTKRPAGYDATLHRKYPAINVHADAGEELARHAARISRIIDE